ncbi:retrotransposon protein, putative, ty1-copia subclass [Tanacetum coccineum]
MEVCGILHRPTGGKPNLPLLGININGYFTLLKYNSPPSQLPLLIRVIRDSGLECRIAFSLVLVGVQQLETSSENGVNPPAPNPSHNSRFSLLSVLGRERLTGPNYMDWMRNLRFTLRVNENKEYVLDEQILTINDNSTQDEIEAHQKHYDDANKLENDAPRLTRQAKERLDVVSKFPHGTCSNKTLSLYMCFSLREKGDQEIDVPLFHSSSSELTLCTNAKKRKTSPFQTGKEKEACASNLQHEGAIGSVAGPKVTEGPQDGKVEKGGHSASPCKGIYETIECIDNGNVILNVGLSNELDKSKLWHSRLGHINKTQRPSSKRTCERGEGLLDLVHTDVCGPFQSATKDGKHYYVTFTDDFSRYGYVSLIKHTSDTFEVFKRYQNKVENQLGRKIKLTPPRTLQLNGVAERRNRTLLDMVVIMMCRANTSKYDFGENALETTAHILNLVPTKKVSKTPLRSPQDPQFYYDFHIEEDKISDSTLSELDEPTNYKEAMASPEAAKWKEAMKSEIQSMYTTQFRIDNFYTTPVLRR